MHFADLGPNNFSFPPACILNPSDVRGTYGHLARPSHPVVIPRLLGFSWLGIVRIQCFPTSPSPSHGSTFSPNLKVQNE